MYLGDVSLHIKPYPWVCQNPFPVLKGGMNYEAFVFLNAETSSPPVVAAAAASDDTCGGNCPNGCASCPCGSSIMPVDAGHWCNLGTPSSSSYSSNTTTTSTSISTSSLTL
jgi:hypothetical protein